MARSRIFSLVVRYSIMVIVTLLIVEFLLGMWVNLYAAVPVGTKLGLSQPDFAGKFELEIHLIVGIFLGILSIVALIFTSLLKKILAVVFALFGAVSIIVAGVSGLAFASGGYVNNGESYTMSVAFLAAILLYINLGRVVSVPRALTGKISGSSVNLSSTSS